MKTFLYYNTKVIVFLFIIIMGIFLPQNKIISLPVPDLVEAKEELKKYAKVKAIEEKQLACMAKNIYYEAGNESYEGKVAVARVVMNRVRHGFASNPCNVIYQKIARHDKFVCQFSWVCDERPDPNKNTPRYKESMRAAREVMVLGLHKDTVPNSALFFHSVGIDPNWPYRKLKQIGNHIFYEKGKKQ